LVFVAIGSVLIFRKFANEPTKMQSPSQAAPAGREGHAPQGPVLAVYGRAPEFDLTERGGQIFSEKNLLGKPWVADFIFTSCAGQCPLMSLEMRKLQKTFPEVTGLQFVSFTVDPERDTPEVLSQYADRYGAEKDRWFFLTGTRGELDRIQKEFYLTPAEQPMMHSVRFILVDGEGETRGYYDSSDEASMKQLIHDAGVLVNQ